MTVRPTPILLTPGPTPIPPQVQAAMAVPLPHHRTSEFKTIYGAALEKLATGVPHRARRAHVHGVGHRRLRVGVREPALARRSRAVRLGRQLRRSLDRDGEGLRRRGADAARRRSASAPTSTRSSRRSRPTRASRWSCVVHSETSTGTTADIRAIAERTRGRDALLVVDAVSSLGAAPLETDALGPRRRRHRQPEGAHVPSRPGLRERLAACLGARRARDVAPLLLRLEAHRARRRSTARRARTRRRSRCVLGLDAALDMILEDGLEASWARTEELGAMVRGRVRELGLELFSPDEPSLLARDGDLGARGRRRRRRARARSPTATASSWRAARGRSSARSGASASSARSRHAICAPASTPSRSSSAAA